MSSGGFDEQLNEALCTRPCIEQAKGVLATLRHCTAEQASEETGFGSQQHNMKPSALASAVVDTAAELAPEDQRARAVIWVEWGALFPMLVPD